MYKALVHRAISLMKVFLVIKCILPIVSKTPRNCNKEVFLNQEVLRTMIRSSQNLYKISLKNKVEINGIDYIVPRLQKDSLVLIVCLLRAT